VTIVDLKSSDRAQVDSVTETQLHIYALGYQELTGRPADYVEIYELDDQRQKTRSVDDEFIADVKRDVRGGGRAAAESPAAQSRRRRPAGVATTGNLCSVAIVN